MIEAPTRQRSALLLLASLTVLLLAPLPGHAQATDGDGGLMLVMDSSGSMAAEAGGGQTRIQAARQALTSLVDDLPDRSRVGLTVYGHRVGNDDALKDEGCQDVEVIRPIGPLDRDQLRGDITSFEPSGWTPVGLALRTAGDELADVEGNRTIVLVSDGEDTCAPPEPCRVAEELAAEGVDVTVETIGFQVDEAARQELQCIAETTGGSYRDAPDAASLADSLRALSLRAFRAYEPVGEPITGGASRDDAETIEPGAYLDEIAPPDTMERWYRFDVPAGQQFGVSTTLVGDREFEGEVTVFGIEVFPEDSSSPCDRNRVSSKIGRFPDSTAVLGGPDTDCDEGTTFVARVSLRDYPSQARFPLEVELQTMTPGAPLGQDPGLVAAGPGDDVIGGSSYSTAPLVEPGTYRDNIRMWESQIWAIEVARGQTLTVTYRGLPTTSEESALARSLVRSGLRQAGHGTDDDASTTARFDLDEGFEGSYTTDEIGDTIWDVFERSGVFYVSVNLQDGPPTALMDYELTLEVDGEPLPDPTPSPTETASTSPTTDDTPSPTEDATDDPVLATEPEGDGGTPGWLWALLGLVVGAVAVAVWAWRTQDTADDEPGSTS